jgi:hypothetical protein
MRHILKVIKSRFAKIRPVASAALLAGKISQSLLTTRPFCFQSHLRGYCQPGFFHPNVLFGCGL